MIEGQLQNCRGRDVRTARGFLVRTLVDARF